MAKTLDARLSRLEAGRDGPQPLVIFLKGYRHPDDSTLPKAIVGSAGQRWERLEDESEAELCDRASREVQRNQWGVALLSVLP